MSATREIEDAIFLSALDIAEPAVRREFLDRACTGDASLRATVDAMLADDERAKRFFAKGEAAFQKLTADVVVSVSAKASLANAPILDDQIGKRVGPYKLLQRIGEGGCGVVYMAEQEKPVRRRVALKLIKLGMDTKSVMARFEAERQALALMDHPNIARVLDAGATETGRPYFVMELVRGVRITEYCDANNLSPEERLKLFIQVCHAIQHAHQKGIVHRDIKPSNILVTLHDGVPVPKVIDFGIAKAIEGRLTDQTLFTAYEQLVGTPAYMSPEQAEFTGLDVDTRSDIYSLGVLLYELLTGKTPFDSKVLVRGGLDQFRRTLREEEPQRPSTILTTLHGTELRATAEHRHADPPRLVSLLKGDLDWIVMKALEKDRARRYQTANGLAMDVQRYLNNEPVVARPPSRLYLFRKLVRRNKAVFAAGAAVALALLIGLGTSTWLFFKAEDARANEAALRRQAEARGKLSEAALAVSQGKYDEAARLLEEIEQLPAKPSLDGVAALRSVGEWLALQARWRQAANRFLPLMEIDRFDDWNLVTLDYQSCGAVLVECGDKEGYNGFRKAAAARFADGTSSDGASRILKTCLLPPVTQDTIELLRPLGAKVDQWVASPDFKQAAPWASIPVALWRYRCGDFAAAGEFSRRGLDPGNTTSAKDATFRVILAMSHLQTGHFEQAQPELAGARQTIEAKFQHGLDRGNGADGMWYDWVFARILLREATQLVKAGSPPARR